MQIHPRSHEDVTQAHYYDSLWKYIQEMYYKEESCPFIS